jgi:hypothetical protein
VLGPPQTCDELTVLRAGHAASGNRIHANQVAGDQSICIQPFESPLDISSNCFRLPAVCRQDFQKDIRLRRVVEVKPGVSASRGAVMRLVSFLHRFTSSYVFTLLRKRMRKVAGTLRVPSAVPHRAMSFEN